MWRRLLVTESTRWFKHLPSPYLNSYTRSYSTAHATADTIYALSSGASKAGVAVIRVSGPNANRVLTSIGGRSRRINPREATFCRLHHPRTGELLDRGLLLWFPRPRSFTGEDTVELHVHGGNAVVRGVLDALDSLEQFRMAERGEFAQRAFENDKLDLTEVEGLADLINAETEAQRRLALRQAGGALRERLDTWRRSIIEAQALIEAIIDFGEDEGIEEGIYEQVIVKVQNMTHAIKQQLNDHRRGEILRSGIHLTIFGPPNAGKSSLLNLLAQRQAAIVSPIAGTTRDIVECTINIGGYPLVIGDTAGLRTTSDTIEVEGIRRTQERITMGDINLCMFDIMDLHRQISTSNVCGTEDVQNNNQSSLSMDIDQMVMNAITEDTIILLNKADLLAAHTPQMIQECRTALGKCVPTSHIHVVSCQTQEGMSDFFVWFQQYLSSRFDMGNNTDYTLITQARHRSNLTDCVVALDTFLAKSSDDIVLAAEDLRHAAHALGRITGRVDVEEILDVIFREFCIGK
ncbi:hypothetical protein BDF22DRAFT_701301 [Syncephalis plumigaleata]|nr:hypothetical protein BDF22DRAFT_701301 [Syncephalis plumigaleata]